MMLLFRYLESFNSSGTNEKRFSSKHNHIISIFVDEIVGKSQLSSAGTACPQLNTPFLDGFVNDATWGKIDAAIQ